MHAEYWNAARPSDLGGPFEAVVWVVGGGDEEPPQAATAIAVASAAVTTES